MRTWRARRSSYSVPRLTVLPILYAPANSPISTALPLCLLRRQASARIIEQHQTDMGWFDFVSSRNIGLLSNLVQQGRIYDDEVTYLKVLAHPNPLPLY